MRNQIDRRKINLFNTLLHTADHLRLLRQVIHRMKEDRIRCIISGQSEIIPELDFSILQYEVKMLSAYVDFLKTDRTLTELLPHSP